jgi:hypothetical protein
MFEEIKKESQLSVEEQLKRARVKKLKDFCSQHGNSITIKDYGENFELEPINIETASKKEKLLRFSKLYLNGITFTDSCEKDNDKRRELEKAIEELEKTDFKRKLYYSNRLASNNFGGVGWLEDYIQSLEDSEIKNHLLQIQKRINDEAGDLVNKNDKNLIKYHFLEDEEKVELVAKFSEIIKELVDILEKENEE